MFFRQAQELLNFAGIGLIGRVQGLSNSVNMSIIARGKVIQSFWGPHLRDILNCHFSRLRGTNLFAGEAVKKLLMVCLLLIASIAQAQDSDVSYYRNPVNGRVRFISVDPGAQPVMSAARSSGDAVLVARGFLKAHAAALGILTGRDSFALLGSDKDETNMWHVRFERRYRGVPVYGAKTTVHLKQDYSLRAISGPGISVSELSTTPVLSALEAEQRAREVWAAAYPGIVPEASVAKLMLFGRELLDPLASEPWRLVWVVPLYSLASADADSIMIDAHDGAFVFREVGRRREIYREIWDCSFGSGDCYPGSYSVSYDYYFGRSEGQAPVGGNPIPGNRWDWTGSRRLNSYGSTGVDDVYATLGQLDQYLREVFGRSGANGAGGIGDGNYTVAGKTKAYVFVDWSPDMGAALCPNAWFTPLGFMGFCHNVVERDIVAHEYGHALSGYAMGNGGFVYSGESGAMSEGISDVFAELFQSWLLGSADWINSSELVLRSLSNPTSSTTIFGAMPDRTFSPNYYCGSEDNGGAHHNMGVFTKASYLAAMGGSFNGCVIEGIGAERYARVLYLAMTTYFQATSDFAAVYSQMLAACQDLYLSEGSTCNNLAKAFLAVEADQAGICSGIGRTDPTSACLIANDYCPDDSSKTFPGTCGCGTADLDSDGSGIMDCLYGAELRDRLTKLKSLVKKLKVAKTRKAQMALKLTKSQIKTRLSQMLKIVKTGGSNIDTKKPVKLSKTASNTNKAVKAALNVSGSRFAENKKAATKALADFLKLLA